MRIIRDEEIRKESAGSTKMEMQRLRVDVLRENWDSTRINETAT